MVREWKWAPYVGVWGAWGLQWEKGRDREKSTGSRGPGRQEGPRGRPQASPDRAVLRRYLLRTVLGLGCGGKARGISGLKR